MKIINQLKCHEICIKPRKKTPRDNQGMNQNNSGMKMAE